MPFLGIGSCPPVFSLSHDRNLLDLTVLVFLFYDHCLEIYCAELDFDFGLVILFKLLPFGFEDHAN